MKILKRNQIIISVLALMLITVGYMSYTSNMQDAVKTSALTDSEKIAGIGDAKLVNSSSIAEENNENEESSSSNSDTNNTNDANAKEVIGESAETVESSETQETSSKTEVKNTSNDNVANTSNIADYFVSARIDRDKMYSQMIETYTGLVQNGTTSPEQKNISSQEIANINNKKNSIMIAENLIKNLGFDDVVIFVNNNSTSVIVKAEKLTDADIAQIQNVVCREIGVEVQSIHISTK